MKDTNATIAKRVDSGIPDTDAIRELAESAGCKVVGEVTQFRPEGFTDHLGSGKEVDAIDAGLEGKL